MSSLSSRGTPGPAALILCVVLVALPGPGCASNDRSSDADGGPAIDGGSPPTVLGGDRPVTLERPASFDPARAYPLLLLLHGYGSDGDAQQRYFGFADGANQRGALLLAPDGTVDARGSRFWSASDACCDFDATGVDDVRYLGDLIDAVRASYRVERVYVAGLSNGAFMSYRLACERADVVDGIVALAGAAAFLDPAACAPSEPVNVLHVHGDADATVPYAGGELFGTPIPGAVASTERWAMYDGCTGADIGGPALDLEANLAGAETTRAVATGCPAGLAVELWTVHGGAHVPSWRQPAFADAAWSWLVDHPRP